ncbi:AraC family transcriptional regulator [Paenibacillus hexagrammi]|uniref:AraC family transcriptional regulator n=1 Tax=Paenibacillus hexagrammi TaxID=2908839 RepID=A0ABY3SH80_9BACL|nr:AraC family transcriptional regulator [Paenibacillus sp. YPD9-1]UJF32559.1 AraC family transcriptional regulator [Paenibacillus sp. YPD9-1]
MNPDHHYFSVTINPHTSTGELSVLFSGEGRPVPLHKMGPAVHDYYLIHTVLSGKGTFTQLDQTYTCTTGDSFIIFPGELFSYEADAHEPWHYVWVALTGRSALPTLSVLGASPANPIISGSNTKKIRHLYRRLFSCFPQTAPPAVEDMESAGWLRLLLHELANAERNPWPAQSAHESAGHRQVGQAIRYLELQFTQSVSIEQLARTVGYHRTHFCKMFKQVTGYSPMQYLLKIRMERAEQLLATSMTIDQVAASVGYNDALYFSKLFHKWSGSAPTVFRKSIQQASTSD